MLGLKSFAQYNGIRKLDVKEYTKLNDVVSYKVFKSGKEGGKLIKDSDLVFMHMMQQCGDSLLGSTYRDVKNGIYSRIMTDKRIDDYSKVLFQLRPGDSTIVKFNADSVLKQGKPPFYKEGDELRVSVKIIRIVGKKELDSLEKDAERQQEEAKKLEELEKEKHRQYLVDLIPKEDSIIEAYAAKNSIKWKKTKEGLYYSILKLGLGKTPEKEDEVSVIYRGTYLNDTTFDVNLNMDKPFKFTLGNGMVIKAWDEGIALLPVGSKAVFLIPSRLAYGDRGFNGVIPENTILKYELEILESTKKK